jgi:hypothetical protein
MGSIQSCNTVTDDPVSLNNISYSCLWQVDAAHVDMTDACGASVWGHPTMLGLNAS